MYDYVEVQIQASAIDLDQFIYEKQGEFLNSIRKENAKGSTFNISYDTLFLS